MPALSMALNAIITASDGPVGAANIDSLYDRFIGTERLARHAERTSLQVLGEIDGLMTLVDQALVRASAIMAVSAPCPMTFPACRPRQAARGDPALVMSTREEVTRKGGSKRSCATAPTRSATSARRWDRRVPRP